MFKTLELPGGFASLAPLPGLCPGPTGGLQRPPDPSPNNFAPPISNSWLRPWCIVGYFGRGRGKVEYISNFKVLYVKAESIPIITILVLSLLRPWSSLPSIKANCTQSLTSFYFKEKSNSNRCISLKLYIIVTVIDAWGLDWTTPTPTPTPKY